MRIGIDASRTAVSHRTGTEYYSLRLINELLAQDQEDDFVLYFRSPPSAIDFAFGDRAKARVIPFPRLWTHARLSWEMLTRPPDLLFVPAHVLPLIHPSRSVVTVHDLGYLYHRHAHRTFDWVYLHLSTRYNARSATRVLADSDATKNDLVLRYGINPDKIATVHLAHDERFRPVEDAELVEATKRKYEIPGPYLLCLGTIQPRKNLAGTLSAYAALKRRLGKAPKLVLVGKRGWLSQGIFKQVRAVGIDDDVVFTGYVADEDLPPLLSGALALVFASLYEGFGLPALEAMACGTPVIASNLSSLPEVVGDAGLLVDPHDARAIADAMVEVCTDANLRQRMREKGLVRASLFSWERCASETLRVLREAAR